MNKAQLLYNTGEPFAAGFYEAEAEGKGVITCFARAHKRFWENYTPCEYKNDYLYPRGYGYGDDKIAVRPHFCKTYQIDFGRIRAKSDEAADIIDDFNKRFAHGGWSHSMPYYERIIKEGFNSYRVRIEKLPDGDFREGMLEMVEAAAAFVARIVEHLTSVNARPELIAAFKKVPFEPAETVYEAIVAWNFLYYLDGGDNLGIVDSGLYPYWKGEDITAMYHEMFENVCATGGWSAAIGGVGYSELTVQALIAIRGLSRPMLELRTTPEMPDEIWDVALETLRTGNGQPAFYNENGIQAMLRKKLPNAPDADLKRFCGGGCTETTLAGITNAGGTDDDMNTAKAFEEFLQSDLEKCDTFEQFYDGFNIYLSEKVKRMTAGIRDLYQFKHDHLPNPIRTLTHDDCIDRGIEFNRGGTRYTWSIPSESGLINTIDSLLALRHLVFREKKYTKSEFLSLLASQDADFLAECRKCPCYGIDDDDSDAIAADFAEKFYETFEHETLNSGDPFFPTSHQFMRYTGAGQAVGATPDGRKAHEPLCDSNAPLRGKAVEGPTALLTSAGKLPQDKVYGIAVLNFTISKSFSAPILRSLIQAYHKMGGIQIQITVTTKEELLDAMKNPHLHNDLIVRVGGYSEYFNRLSKDLKKAVVERTVYEI
jgi:Pyruvate-formate lyase